MLRNRFEWAILFFISGLLGTAWIIISREPPAPTTGPITLTEAPMVGHLAPDFTLTTPTGQEVILSQLVDRSGNRGQPVVLNFWASWCPPCRVEMPDFQRVSLKYSGRAAVLGINQGESSRLVADFGAEYGITYPLLVDDDSIVNRLYAVYSLPTTIFIDAQGVVREVKIGILNQAILEDRIEGLLREMATQ